MGMLGEWPRLVGKSNGIAMMRDYCVSCRSSPR